MKIRTLKPNTIFKILLKLSVFVNNLAVINAQLSDDGFMRTTQILSKGPSVKTCSRLVHLACIPLCPESQILAWTCQCCRNARKLGYRYVSLVNNTMANTMCLLAVNERAKELVVSCRGTTNFRNILTDFRVFDKRAPSDCEKVPSLELGRSGIWVQSGFYSAACSVYPELLEKVKRSLRKYKGFNVLFTGKPQNVQNERKGSIENVSGHSLGSAMTSIIAYMMINYSGINPSRFITFCGFGQPRVGNQEFADWWNDQNQMEVTRVVNKLDIIPHLYPPELGYVHQGTELWFTGRRNTSCSKELYEDPLCSKSRSPFYNLEDHIKLWNVNVAECTLDDMEQFARDIVLPMDTIISKQMS